MCHVVTLNAISLGLKASPAPNEEVGRAHTSAAMRVVLNVTGFPEGMQYSVRGISTRRFYTLSKRSNLPDN